MKINQENLNYSETNFIQNQAKVTLKKYPAIRTGNTFFISKRDDFLPNIESCKKLRHFCQFFPSAVHVELQTKADKTGLSL